MDAANTRINRAPYPYPYPYPLPLPLPRDRDRDRDPNPNQANTRIERLKYMLQCTMGSNPYLSPYPNPNLTLI